MAVYQVASDADVTGYMDDMMTPGNAMEFLDAGTFTSITIPSTVASGSIFLGETPQVPTCESLTIEKGGIEVRDFTVQLAHDPIPVADGNTQLCRITTSTMAGLEVVGMKFRAGYAGDSYADFDPTAGGDGSLYASIIGDLANSISDADNGLTYYPGGLQTTAFFSGDLLIESCDFDDLKTGLSVKPDGNGNSVRLRRNNVRRCYSDAVNFSLPTTGTFTGPSLLELTGTYYEDAVWCQPQDNSNPHGDLLQVIFGSGDVDSIIPGLFVAGNFAWFRAGFRGLPQRTLLTDHVAGKPFYAPYFVDNFLLSQLNNKGIWIQASGTGAAYAYIDRNTCLTVPTQNVARQNGLYTNEDNLSGSPPVITPIGPSSPTECRINAQWDSTYGTTGKSLIARNISEVINGGGNIDTTTYPNLSLGLGEDSGSYSTGFDTSDWDSYIGAADIIANFTPKAAYADYGAIRSGESLTTFLDRWATDDKPYSRLLSYVGLHTKVRQAAGSAITSDWGYIHAGFGTRTLTPGSGLEWREANDDTGTNATSWSSSFGSVTHGKFLQLRATSSATPGATITKTYTLGSQVLSWQIGTESNVAFPLATFNGTQIVRKSSAVGWNATDAKTFTLAIVLQVDPLSADRTIIASNPSNQGRLIVTALNSTKDLRVTMGNDTPTTILSIDVPMTIDDGSVHTILLSVDLAQTSAATGVKCYVDDVSTAVTQNTWTQDGLFNFNATNNPQVGGLASTPAYSGDFGAFWFLPGTALDLADSDIRGRFDPAYIGPAGEGPTGTAPGDFLVGVATTWESGDPNVGTDAAWAKVAAGSTITAGNGEVWPPALQLNAEVLTAGPYQVNDAIDILVTAAGYPKSINLTSSSDKTGTWVDDTQNMPLGSNGITFTYTPTGDAGQTHTLSWTNDGGYTNPVNVEIAVAASGSAPRMGGISLRLGLGL